MLFLLGNWIDEGLKKSFLNSSIYVLTSKSESFSLSLCEAMSYGIPSISFDVDVGPREIIKDMEDGFLVENKNIMEMAENLYVNRKWTTKDSTWNKF